MVFWSDDSMHKILLCINMSVYKGATIGATGQYNPRFDPDMAPFLLLITNT